MKRVTRMGTILTWCAVTDASLSPVTMARTKRRFAFIPASPDWTGSPEQVAEWDRHVANGTAVRIVDPAKREAERLAFLARAQYVDPRERRA